MPENQEKRDDATKVDAKMAATEADILEKLEMDGRVAYKREGLYFALEQDTDAEDGYSYLGPYDENHRPVQPLQYDYADDPYALPKDRATYALPDDEAVSIYADIQHQAHYEDKNVWGLTEGTSREFVDYEKLMEAVDAQAKKDYAAEQEAKAERQRVADRLTAALKNGGDVAFQIQWQYTDDYDGITEPFGDPVLYRVAATGDGRYEFVEHTDGDDPYRGCATERQTLSSLAEAEKRVQDLAFSKTTRYLQEIDPQQFEKKVESDTRAAIADDPEICACRPPKDSLAFDKLVAGLTATYAKEAEGDGGLASSIQYLRHAYNRYDVPMNPANGYPVDVYFHEHKDEIEELARNKKQDVPLVTERRAETLREAIAAEAANGLATILRGRLNVPDLDEKTERQAVEAIAMSADFFQSGDKTYQKRFEDGACLHWSRPAATGEWHDIHGAGYWPQGAAAFHNSGWHDAPGPNDFPCDTPAKKAIAQALAEGDAARYPLLIAEADGSRVCRYTADALAVEAKRLHVVKERPLAALVDKAMSKLFPKKKEDAKEKGQGRAQGQGAVLTR